MTYRLTIASRFSRAIVEDRLLRAITEGPFLVRDLAPAAPGVWTFSLEPRRPEMAIGFAKVAELLVLLGREFEIQSLARFPERAIAAAS
jgi:hypothetical protein